MVNDRLGPLMIDVAGLELTEEDCEILEHPAVGGVIIFLRNYQSIEQITHLNHQIKNLKIKNKKNGNSLLIAVDQEGGTVQRLKHPLTVLPSMVELGKYYEYDHHSALSLAKQLGWLLASELQSLGFDFSFTPVVDLNLCDNKIVKLRSFHKKSSIVSSLALALKSGLNHAGMPAVAKHFPGHGGVEADSHFSTPVDNREYNELDNHDLVPYKHLIADNLEAIMTAHILYNNIDQNIVSFSKFWLNDILREKLNFRGLIVSDDLNMSGANFSIDNSTESSAELCYIDRVNMAFKAGCELILLCNNRTAVTSVLDRWSEISWKQSPEYSHKLNNMRSKIDNPVSLSQLQKQSQWQEIIKNMENLNKIKTA